MSEAFVECLRVLLAQEVNSLTARSLDRFQDQGASDALASALTIDDDNRKIRLDLTVAEHLSESDHPSPIDRDYRVTPDATSLRPARSRSAVQEFQRSAAHNASTSSRSPGLNGRISAISVGYHRHAPPRDSAYSLEERERIKLRRCARSHSSRR